MCPALPPGAILALDGQAKIDRARRLGPLLSVAPAPPGAFGSGLRLFW